MADPFVSTLVRMPPRMHEALKGISEVENRPLGEIIRELIATYIKDHHTDPAFAGLLEEINSSVTTPFVSHLFDLATTVRFWRQVKVGKPHECWFWKGGVKEHRPRKDYGVFCVNGEVRLASHIAWEMMHDKAFPDSLWALHKCDTPRCTNPHHIFLGDNAVNMADMAAKGRGMSGNTRKTHCKRGHPFTDENTYIPPSGGRHCRICREQQIKEWRESHA